MTSSSVPTATIEITASGSMRIDRATANRFFPDDVLVALWRDESLLLLPTRGAAAGGLILKQRTPDGDRSVLIAEVFDFQIPDGSYLAAWDPAVGGLRVAVGGAMNDATHGPNTPLITRPQPVGLFPFPASHLLLPAAAPPEDDRARASLLAGDVSADVPEAWRFFVTAAGGAQQQAWTEVGGTDPIAQYNQFLLAPTAADFERLGGEFTGPLREMLDVAAFAHGLIHALPMPSGLDGELLAVALMTAATGRIEKEEYAAAVQMLQTAVDTCTEASPVFAALLELQLAEICQARPDADPARIIEHYRQSLRLAAGARFPLLRAELWMKLGISLQHAGGGIHRQAILAAIEAYQAALQSGVSEQEHPQWFGQLQNNLGLAYLSIPAREASDQLRMGIAVQSFRHALKVYDRQRHPDMWASVMMNLANSLQYMPSSHPQENLVEAVEAYEEVLQVRVRARDPVAYALVLLNQANALAHLGIFKPAVEKLAESYKLFSWHEQAEQAAAAKELLDQIQDRIDEVRAETTAN